MSELPLVSIVTPSLNQGKFIEATIRSVLSQNYPNIEYIVMDGGSEDETLTILRSFGDRIRWVSEPDSGQAQAVNKGWRLARGEILGWLNADDLLARGAVRRAVSVLQAAPELAGVYGDCAYINEDGQPVGKFPSRPYDYNQLVQFCEDFIPQPGTFLRRAQVEQLGMLDEDLHYVMDYDLWLRLGMYARLEYLPEEAAQARLHIGAKTVSSASNFGHELVSVFLRLVQHPDCPSPLLQQKDMILANAFIHAASLCFWGGEMRMVRDYLYRAWRHNPLPKGCTFWRLLAFSLAGRVGWRLAERLHGNPFRLEHGMLR